MFHSGRLLYNNDIAGQYPDSWYAATANNTPTHPTYSGEQSCDVCVIGAGFTGLSAALHLAEQGLDVVLVDAHRIGWGASGRNGGQLGMGQRVEQEELEEMVGNQHAHQLWELACDSVALCKSLIEKHDIQCDLTPGILHTDHRARFVPETQAYVEKLQNEYSHEQIRFVDQDEVRAMVGSEAYYGGSLDMQAAHLHPLNFALGLGDAAARAGVRIFENSPVQRYERTDPAVVHFEQGRLKAGYVLLACNGYLDDLDNDVAAKVMPINNYVLATEPLGEDVARSLIRDNVAVADSKFVVNYYRLSADHRLLFGGGESYRYTFPKDIKGFVRGKMLEIYPQLADTRIDYGWGGTLGITMNRMPHLSKLSGNILNASGFSGHGVGMATFSGKLMAEVVAGTLDKFDVMEKVPTPTFPGGTLLRWPGLVLAMTYYSLRDKL